MSNIRFEGLDEILESLDSTVSVETLDKALLKACLVVERTAKQKAQVGRGTGDLARSIQSKAENGVGIVFTNLEYAPYVEYGTGLFAENGGRTDVPWTYYDIKLDEFIQTCGRDPAPFMRPAIDENRTEVLRIIKEGLIQNG